MNDVRFEKMNLKELRDLKNRVEAAIARRQQRAKAELRQKMAALAAEAGFSLGELIGARKGRRGPVAIKYQHPEDPSLTWTGRGRRPKWLMKAGSNIERFRVG
jgi:DNA-binding protein H-NS